MIAIAAMCVMQALREVALLRAIPVRILAVGVRRETVWRAVRDLSIPPRILGLTYFLNRAPANLTQLSGPVANSVSPLRSSGVRRQ